MFAHTVIRGDSDAWCRSTNGRGVGADTMRRVERRTGRPVTLGLVLACLGGHAPDRRGPQVPVRGRQLGRRPPVPPGLLHGHRAALRDRADRRGPAPLPRRVRSFGAQLRRVPRPDDVPHAGRRMVSGDASRPLLLGQRDPAVGLRGGGGELPLPDRCASGALVRAGAEPRPAGVRELGPARGRPGHRGGAGLLPTPRRVGGGADRAGRRPRSSSRASCSCRSPPIGSAAASPTARSSSGGRPRPPGSP